MRPKRAIAVSVICCAVAQSPISPSTSARRGEGVKFVESLIGREFPTTLYPISKKRVTRPAPIPCDAPVTIAVLVVGSGRVIIFLPSNEVHFIGIQFLPWFQLHRHRLNNPTALVLAFGDSCLLAFIYPWSISLNP